MKFSDLPARVLPVAASAAIVILLYSRVDYHVLIENAGSVRPGWLALYAALVLADPVARGIRWKLLNGSGSTGTSVKAVILGKAANNLLPLRIGDVIRIGYFHERTGVQYRRILASLLAEMVLDIAVLAVMAVVLALLVTGQGRALIVGAALLAPAAVLMCVLAWGKPSESLSGRRGLPRLAGIALQQLRLALAGRNLLSVLASTAATWGIAIAASYCGFRMFLPSVPFIGILASIVFVYFSVLIPSAPGFVGSYHAALAGALAVMGLSFDDYPAVPVVLHLVQYLLQTAAGIAAGSAYLFHCRWRAAWTEIRAARQRLFAEGEGR